MDQTSAESRQVKTPEDYSKQLDRRWSQPGQQDPLDPVRMRTIQFFRHYTRFSGGHLKVSNYFSHALAHPGYLPYICFSPESRWDPGNPWMKHRMTGHVVARPLRAPDLLFVEGASDWPLVPGGQLRDRNTPVINLLQHVRHANPDDQRYRYLAYPAIRICVSHAVSTAVTDSGRAAGPVITIPAAIDLPDEVLRRAEQAKRECEVLIVAPKNPALGKTLAARMEETGLTHRLISQWLPRDEFLAALTQARITLCLPNPHFDEGFYLPALEAMALGSLVICPDAVGNQQYCQHKKNCLMPDANVDALFSAVAQARALRPRKFRAMLKQAQATSQAYSMAREREHFHEILSNIDDLWQNR